MREEIAPEQLPPRRWQSSARSKSALLLLHQRCSGRITGRIVATEPLNRYHFCAADASLWCACRCGAGGRFFPGTCSAIDPVPLTPVSPKSAALFQGFNSSTRVVDLATGRPADAARDL